MNTYLLDVRNLGERKQAHAYLKEVFDFPDYYGHNLDALHDCLTDLGRPQILLTHADEAGAYFLDLYPLLLEDADVSIIH